MGNFVSIITMALVVAFIIFSIIIYLILYNRNANKALKSGRSNVLLDKGPFVSLFTSLVSLVLIIILLFQVSDLKTMNQTLYDRLGSTNSELSILRSYISDLKSNFDKFIEEQKNVYDASYTFIDADIEEKTISTKVSFSLREVKNTSKIYLQAVNVEDENDVLRIELTGPLTYTTTLDLKYNNTYKLVVLEEGIDSTKANELFMVNASPGIFNFKFDINFSNDMTEFRIYINNPTGIEAFDIIDIKLVIKDKEKKLVFDESIFSKLVKEDSYYIFTLNSELLKVSENYEVIMKIYNHMGEIKSNYSYEIFNKR